MLRSDTDAGMVIPESVPRDALRVRVHGAVDTGYEVWQLPAPSAWSRDSSRRESDRLRRSSRGVASRACRD